MELDDFKTGKIPAGSNEVTYNQQEIEGLITRIQANFKKQKRVSIYFAVVLIAMAGLYFSIHEKGNPILNLGFALLSIGFILGALYLYLKSRLLSDAMYFLPLTEFLNAAEKRLQYMRLSDWLIVIPLLLLLGTGGGIVLVNRLLNYTDNLNLLIIIWVVFFTGLCVFGTWAGRGNWRREHGALLSEVMKLKETLLNGADK